MMNTTQARRGLVAALAFMLPFLSLVTLWGVSLSSFLFLLAALLWFTPCRAALAQHWTSVRVAQGVTDVHSWHAGGSAYTNMGIRMELWKASGQLISERPSLGRSLPEARREMARRVAGLFSWLSILAAPLIFFVRSLRLGDGERLAPALACMLVVTSYLCFGLTEVIFWSVKASLLYALMVFILMGLCLNTENTKNTKEHERTRWKIG